ncbi:MAG: SDR family NAD(P)-dependent oxidoreductase [Bdellovibrionales bacterium]|nr:SDR family NAD(P)-dependent oxidoreductase [Bdellovibrionales bacterium]
MHKTVLITGGAGFIGSHLCDRLLAANYRVRVLDALDDQVHQHRTRPEYLSPEVELLIGDVRDARTVERALHGVDIVCHLAAAVGVGQSMYQIQRYTEVNNVGTAVLLEALARRPVEKLLVASSMSIYGEGLYASQSGELLHDAARSMKQLRESRWEVYDAEGRVLQPLPTAESKTPLLSSVYALSKYDQERLCLLSGAASGISTIALRFFNVYGPRQALSNPYTGVLAIFASRLLNGRAPRIFEDGYQRRDFVSVYDVAKACLLAIESSESQAVFNIGSGQSVTVREIAEELAAILHSDIAPEVTGEYRVGDIRHCFADISAARSGLGYHPRVPLDAGIADLAEWLSTQAADDRFDDAHRELHRRGLAL